MMLDSRTQRNAAMRSESVNSASAEFLATHGALVSWLHAQSRAGRWEVSRERFATALHRSVAHRFGEAMPADDGIETYLRGLHLEDLALVCALCAGSEAAWEEFVAAYRPVLYAAARAIVGAGGDARASELADSLYAELYGLDRAAGARRRSLLDYFHGRSKLATWLRAVLAQRHVDALRSARRTESLDENPAPRRGAAMDLVASRGGRNAPDESDPDRARLLPRLRQAVAGAFAALPPADRLLLSFYYLQELTLAQIAAARGVHEATISRQLERIRGELRGHAERSLAAAMSPAEVQLCFSLALEDWPFDLGRALEPNVAAKEPEGL